MSAVTMEWIKSVGLSTLIGTVLGLLAGLFFGNPLLGLILGLVVGVAFDLRARARMASPPGEG